VLLILTAERVSSNWENSSLYKLAFAQSFEKNLALWTSFKTRTGSHAFAASQKCRMASTLHADKDLGIKHQELGAGTDGRQTHYKPVTDEEKALDRRVNLKLDFLVISTLALAFTASCLLNPSPSYNRARVTEPYSLTAF